MCPHINQNRFHFIDIRFGFKGQSFHYFNSNNQQQANEYLKQILAQIKIFNKWDYDLDHSLLKLFDQKNCK